MSSRGEYEGGGGELVPLRNNLLLPTAKLDDQKFEFYFLLDVSGSMSVSCQGGIARVSDLASRALVLFLQSLPEDCYFNVVAFDEHCTPVFPKSVKYTQETLDKAKNAIPGLWRYGYDDNIHAPLQTIYNAPQTPGYLTQIFAITDGCVQSTKQGGVSWQDILNMMSSKVKHSRTFAMGIGSGVNRDFIRGMGDNSGGMHEFVDASDQIQSKILNMLKIALKPALLKPIRVAGASRLIPMLEP